MLLQDTFQPNVRIPTRYSSSEKDQSQATYKAGSVMVMQFPPDNSTFRDKCNAFARYVWTFVGGYGQLINIKRQIRFSLSNFWPLLQLTSYFVFNNYPFSGATWIEIYRCNSMTSLLCIALGCSYLTLVGVTWGSLSLWVFPFPHWGVGVGGGDL